MSVSAITNDTFKTNNPGPRPPVTSTPDIARQPTKEAAKDEYILDIEHNPVDDDPRKWSHVRKTTTLCIVSAVSLTSTLASNIQNPMNEVIARDLHATSEQISWSLATFIIVQGIFPLAWSAASEIKGRKLVYIVATTFFVLASAILANAATVSVLIGMRVVQAAGCSVSMAMSAATLADIYETHERGKVMGIFFAVPFLGPALGSIIGSCLSETFGWRASFYFLAACGGILLAAFIFLFKDPFRIERSLTYQAVLRRRTNAAKDFKSVPDSTIAESDTRAEEEASSERESLQQSSVEEGMSVTKAEPGLKDIRLSLWDVDPFRPFWKVMRQRNNLAILLANGLMFTFSYILSYTSTRTLSMQYNYGARFIGIVLLSLGVGSIVGGVVGGLWSDRVMTKTKNGNGGKWYPEMRLKSTTLAMVWLPPSVAGYGWAAEKHADVVVICVMLFLCGFFSIWTYSSALTYVVDANPGRSSSAVAANNWCRCTLGFACTVLAIPLQDATGDGWLYTGFAGIMVVTELLIFLVLYKGRSWREQMA